MKMRSQRPDTRRVTPVDWTAQRMPSRRDNLRSRQGFPQERNLHPGRARYPTTPEEERPMPARPPSRKSVYCRPQTRRAKPSLRPAPVPEETDSEFSSSEPEWSKGPYPGDLRCGWTPEDVPGLVPLKRSPGYRTLTRSLGPAPIPCKHPIPYISKSLPNAVSTVRVALRVRPGTYFVWRTPPRTPLHAKPMKSRSDETANTSKLYKEVAAGGDGGMIAQAKAAPKVKVTTRPEPAPKPGPSKSQARQTNHNGGGGGAVAASGNRKGKTVLSPNALIRMVNAKQIRHDNSCYKERIRNAKPSQQIANAFRRGPKP